MLRIKKRALHGGFSFSKPQLFNSFSLSLCRQLSYRLNHCTWTHCLLLLKLIQVVSSESSWIISFWKVTWPLETVQFKYKWNAALHRFQDLPKLANFGDAALRFRPAEVCLLAGYVSNLMTCMCSVAFIATVIVKSHVWELKQPITIIQLFSSWMIVIGTSLLTITWILQTFFPLSIPNCFERPHGVWI